jgi:DNA-binding response OmpR family regulator
MSGDEEKALEAGCNGYFTKPIDRRALLAGIARHLAPSHPRATDDTP